MTLVFYEAPHRIEKMLTDAYEIFGDRQACLARELTKMHEEFLRGTLGELVHACQDLRGEMVVVIAGSREDPAPDIDYSHLLDQVQQAIAAGMSARDAVRSIAAANGISKNDLYEHYLKKEGRA
jgi:16S rRNA (cytidine1402-2'-O)-methyltransferase